MQTSRRWLLYPNGVLVVYSRESGSRPRFPCPSQLISMTRNTRLFFSTHSMAYAEEWDNYAARARYSMVAMSSQAQIEANRHNSQKSTGPRSNEGMPSLALTRSNPGSMPSLR
jgi:hypothetical protein